MVNLVNRYKIEVNLCPRCRSTAPLFKATIVNSSNTCGILSCRPCIVAFVAQMTLNNDGYGPVSVSYEKFGSAEISQYVLERGIR